MAGEKPKLTIFISYSWANKDIADEIDKYFSSVGMSLTRDVRDSKFRDSIKEFMKKIGKCDFVFMLISKEFLQSPNCMYEAMELFKKKNYKKRFLPLVLENANFYKPGQRIEYINYWENNYKKLDEDCKSIDTINLDDSLLRDLKIHKDISENIGKILGIISDMNAKTFEYHKNNNFKDILEIIGFEDKKLLEELFEIIFLDEEGRKLINLDKFLIKNPNHKEGSFFKAYLYGEIKEYDTATILWDNYLNLYKDDYEAWYNKGIAYRKLNQIEKAIECYDKALAIKPDDPEAWNNKGIAYKNLKQYDKAIECYDRAIEIKPDYHEAWYNKGLTFAKSGQFKNAIEYYDKAIEIIPDYHEAWDNKGVALSKLKKYNNALYCHNKSIELNSEYANAWYNLACTYALIGNKPEMLKNLQKAIELDSKYKEDAKTDEDFKAFWDDPDFKKLVD